MCIKMHQSHNVCLCCTKIDSYIYNLCVVFGDLSTHNPPLHTPLTASPCHCARAYVRALLRKHYRKLCSLPFAVANGFREERVSVFVCVCVCVRLPSSGWEYRSTTTQKPTSGIRTRVPRNFGRHLTHVHDNCQRVCIHKLMAGRKLPPTEFLETFLCVIIIILH